MLFTTSVMVILAGVLSLAVDYGRLLIVDADLQTASDAAARYAAGGIGNGTAETMARQVMIDNGIDPDALAQFSVTIGQWDAASGSFSTGGEANAVRVVARRSLDLLLGGLVGRTQVEASSSSIVLAAPTSAGGYPYGIVSLESMNLNGTVDFDAYDSSKSNSVVAKGHAATNGHVYMNSGVEIHGNL
ncbi:MAG: TadG family pilus assembly protein [Phycisphaerae bacterium]